jgi:dihydroflavonol-4-reductase
MMKTLLTPEKKILLMGGSGHLGSALAHHLVHNLHIPAPHLRIFYLPGSPTHSLRDLDGLDFCPGNILNPSDVQKAFADVHLVFHMIGNTSFDPRAKWLQWQINVEGTRNVIECARKSPTLERICYTSTVNTLAIPHPIGSLGTIASADPYRIAQEAPKGHPRMHSFQTAEETLTFADKIHKGEISRKKAEKRIHIGYFDSKLAAQELINRYVRDHGGNVVSVLPGTMFGPYDYLIGSGMYILSLYQNKMPGALPGGFPLCHVMDSAEGHCLVMNTAKTGSRYIISGLPEDNRHILDMAGIIVDVLQERFPEKEFKRPQRIFRPGVAMIGATIMELISKIFRKTNPLSKVAVKCGALPSFYSSEEAIRDLGYQPKRTFRQAVAEMVDYYMQEGLLETTDRYLDKTLVAKKINKSEESPQ